MLDAITRDLRYALRSLRKTPAFTLAAIGTLALGIGANAALFSVTDATALRPPDVARPGELVRVFTSTKDMPYGELPYPDYLAFRSAATSMSGLVAYETGDFALAKNRQTSALYLGGWLVTANFFSVLGVEPAIGRTFRPEEETTPSPVIVISHRLWEREFAKDATVIGREVLVSGAPFTIIGVAPETFRGTELYFHPDIFIPLSAIRVAYPTLPNDPLEDRGDRWLTVLGRLRPGTTADQASSEIAVLAERLEQAHPESNRARRAFVLPEVTARARLDEGSTEGAFAIMGVVGLVLLLACANVANLVLSRSTDRRRDLALRAALGATRGQLVRQLLAESAMLALAGGAAALLVGGWAIAYLSRVIIIPSALPLFVDLRLDGRVAAFTLAASVITAVLVGFAPALQTSRASLNSVLKLRPEPLPRRVTLRTALVVLQVAISVLVLVAAGLLMRAAGEAQRVDPGFHTDRVLLASFNPALVRYDTPQARAFYRNLVDRTRALPGIAAVGLTRYVPLGVTNGSIGLLIDGTRIPEGQGRVSIAETTVDPGYWQVMRTAIVRGRAFNDNDTSSSPRVVIVNETMARKYWPDQDVIGKTVRIPDVPGPNGPRTLVLEIVGVARDGKYWTLAEPTQPFIYRPVAQSQAVSLTMVMLAAGDAEGLAPVVRGAASAVDATVPIFDVRTLDNLYQSRALMAARLVSRIFTALSVLALLLASVGLYGVIAYLFSRRTQEIGIRIAVGATTNHVLMMVFSQTAAFVVPGLVLGLVLAALVTPLLASPAFDFVTPGDPLVMTVASLTMLLVALIAAAFPALRATRVNPTTALRAQ